MTVTYEQAREIVRQATEPSWFVGTYCLDDRRVVENDDFFVFEVGAREFLVDDEMSYAIAGSVPIVYKGDGRLEWVASPVIAADSSITSRSNPDPTLTINADS
jgi:hypothetical protein